VNTAITRHYQRPEWYNLLIESEAYMHYKSSDTTPFQHLFIHISMSQSAAIAWEFMARMVMTLFENGQDPNIQL